MCCCLNSTLSLHAMHTSKWGSLGEDCLNCIQTLTAYNLKCTHGRIAIASDAGTAAIAISVTIFSGTVTVQLLLPPWWHWGPPARWMNSRLKWENKKYLMLENLHWPSIVHDLTVQIYRVKCLVNVREVERWRYFDVASCISHNIIFVTPVNSGR